MITNQQVFLKKEILAFVKLGEVHLPFLRMYYRINSNIENKKIYNCVFFYISHFD